MIDLRTRMTDAVLAAGLVLTSAGIGAAQDFVDDFEDRSLFDGSPVGWGPEATWSRGIYDASSGDLVVGSHNRTDVTLPAQVFFADSVSVRTRLSIKPGSSPAVFFGTVVGGAYLAEIRTEAASGSFNIRRWDGALPLTVLAETPLPVDFDPSDDHYLQLDVNGDLVEMRVWRPGEPFPGNPVVSAIDTTYRTGNVGIDVRLGDNQPPPQTSLTTYRFLQASSEMITNDGAPRFRRGDCNGDGEFDVSDPIASLSALFLGEGNPECDDACDSNDDEVLDVSDPVASLFVIFLGQGSVPPPGAAQCGVDPADPAGEKLGCERYEECPRL